MRCGAVLCGAVLCGALAEAVGVEPLDFLSSPGPGDVANLFKASVIQAKPSQAKRASNGLREVDYTNPRRMSTPAAHHGKSSRDDKYHPHP
jgi:hypothetical protein